MKESGTSSNQQGRRLEMATIINDALSVLDDLERKIGELSRNLRAEEQDAFSNHVAQAQGQLESLVKSGSFTEYDLAEAANELIDGINAYPAVAEAISSGEQISSSEERATQLAQLEKSERFTRAARPTHPEKSKVEQYAFLANQIINKCQIVRKAMDSERRADAKSHQGPTPR
jgi:hypothetical protein